MSTDLTNGRRMIIRLAGLAVLVVLAGCSSIYPTPGSDPGGDPDGAGATISITEPGENASVTQPFTLKVDSSVELGAPESGQHHLHLTFDGNADDYTVEPDGELTIDQLSPGSHTIKVTLQHADHSPAGAEDEVTVTVADGPGPPPSQQDPGSGSDGY